MVIITVDYESDEAIYMQLRNQIIMGIARNELQEGDSLPSVRRMAEEIGVNMHTVNKAYAVLRQEGFVQLDRRNGAVIAFDIDRMQAVEDMREEMLVILAKAICKNIEEDEVHQIVHEIYQGLRKI